MAELEVEVEAEADEAALNDDVEVAEAELEVLEEASCRKSRGFDDTLTDETRAAVSTEKNFIFAR